MNEWERRRIETFKNHLDLMSIAQRLGPNALVEYFGYSAQVGSQAAPLVLGVPQQSIIAVQADSHFVLQYISTAIVQPDVALQGIYALPSGNIILQITDTGAGEVLYSSPANAATVTGTVLPGQTGIPLLLPVPRVIPPNTNIKIEAQVFNSGAAYPAPYACYVSLLGARVAQILGG